uniref:ABC transporter substrate-binding protein n=1 Tax=Rhodococcus qingshengii TaxID=334542 RepID=UPI001C4E1513|nr:ABC transporter substrate-binding protein [Rhodococcus qingshengii]
MTTSRLSSIPIRVAILASTLAVAAGCSTATPAASADSEPVSGGDLTFAINTFPPCIDKTLNGQTATAFHPLYDKLVDQNLETGEIVPWLATSWEVRNDGRRFVFALRDGVTFSNGERLDAQVVADNFESQKRLGDSGFATTAKSHLANFTGAEVLDASTVALNFSEPSASFLQAARSDTLAIIAPESLKKTPEERCAQGVIASGPFVQKELETNAKVVLARRDGYHWGSSLNKNKGEAYLDSITFLVVPESSVRIGGLTSGQLDAAIDIPSTDVDRAEGAGLTVIPSLAAGINDSLLLNPTFAPVLADLNVRRALVKGIDTQQIIDTTYTPSDEKARSILSVKAPGYTDLSSEYTYDPSGAKSLLDASGWTVGGDGFRTKDGEKLTVELAYRNHLPQSQFELIQSQLRDIGVAVNLQPRSTAEDNAARTDGTWESIYFQSLRADGDVLLVFSPTLGSTKGIASTPELNALLVKQSQTVDVDARNGVLKEIQELIADQALAIPLHASSLIYATTSAVHDLRIQADLYSVDFVDAWKS